MLYVVIASLFFSAGFLSAFAWMEMKAVRAMRNRVNKRLEVARNQFLVDFALRYHLGKVLERHRN